MKKLIIIKAIVMAASLFIIAMLHSCTQAPRPNVVEVQVQGVNITYNYAYGYESKIYAINNETTTMLNIGARRMYYIQGASVYTDSVVTMNINLSKGYYNGSAITLNGDKMNIINIKNEKR